MKIGRGRLTVKSAVTDELRVAFMDSPRIGSEVDVEYRRLAEDPAPDSSRPLGKFIKTARKMSPLFWICVVVPTLLSILYFGLFASDVYVSESRFVVRSPDKPASSGFGIFAQDRRLFKFRG
jgi:hypothetical protein